MFESDLQYELHLQVGPAGRCSPIEVRAGTCAYLVPAHSLSRGYTAAVDIILSKYQVHIAGSKYNLPPFV